jgi:hypothetical protein
VNELGAGVFVVPAVTLTAPDWAPCGTTTCTSVEDADVGALWAPPAKTTSVTVAGKVPWMSIVEPTRADDGAYPLIDVVSADAGVIANE